MRKIVTPALLAGAALLAAFGFASATEDRAAAAPAAPSLVRELPATGTATVAGTVAELREDGFVLADPEGAKLRVDAEHLRLAGLAEGEMITVTGRVEEGGLEADHAVRADGTVVARDTGRGEGRGRGGGRGLIVPRSRAATSAATATARGRGSRGREAAAARWAARRGGPSPASCVRFRQTRGGSGPVPGSRHP